MILNFGSATDIAIATAARLSAAFPFVSPAARPKPRSTRLQPFPQGAENLHLVDGGYFDNSGSWSAFYLA